MDELPLELSVKMMGYLDRKSALSFSACSKKLRETFFLVGLEVKVIETQESMEVLISLLSRELRIDTLIIRSFDPSYIYDLKALEGCCKRIRKIILPNYRDVTNKDLTFFKGVDELEIRYSHWYTITNHGQPIGNFSDFSSLLDMEDLRKLGVSDTYLKPIDVEYMRNILSITLVRCKFDRATSLNSLTKLTKLEIAVGQPDDFSFLDHMPNLKDLRLSTLLYPTDFSALSGKSFNRLGLSYVQYLKDKDLMHLHVTRLELSRLPLLTGECLKTIRGVEDISLKDLESFRSSNMVYLSTVRVLHLESVKYTDDDLSHFHQLEQLTLKDTSITGKAFCYMPKLRDLRLLGSAEFIDASHFNRLLKLVKLEISKADCFSLNFEWMCRLEELSAYSVRSIDQALIHGTNLRLLRLHEANIVVDEDLVNLRKVGRLILNEVPYLKGESLLKLSNLCSLEIRNCKGFRAEIVALLPHHVNYYIEPYEEDSPRI